MSGASSELKNTILRAGAGAGKTTTLTRLFLNFASDFKETHDKLPRIVVTTFTRKATQELKERLLALALEEGREDLFHYVSQKGQVQISTIHGVLSLFLSKYGAAVGLTPDFKLMDDREIKKQGRKIIRRHLLENSDYQELMDEYDFAVIEECLHSYYSFWIVNPHLRPASTQDFANLKQVKLKSLGGRILRACQSILDEAPNEKWVSYCESLLRMPWGDSAKQSELIERLESFFSHTKKPVFSKTPFSESLHEEFKEALKDVQKVLEEDSYSPEYWERHHKLCQTFEKFALDFCRDFYRQKIEFGVLSMADLENLSLKIIQDHPDTAQRFSHEWDFWMVDEYQDTSPVQVRLLRSLIGDRPQFVVGDPQQSIYLFRGARSEVFQDKIEEIQSQDGVVNTALVNYRSSPEVLEFFNFFFTRISPQFAAMTPSPNKEKKGRESVVAQILITPDDPQNEEEDQESLTVIARIQELLQAGVSPEQICVLGRTHKTLQNIATRAQTFGVPVQLHSSSGFYQRREVIDALALLKFMITPHDNANLLTLLRSPWLCVEDAELAKVAQLKSVSMWLVMSQVEDIKLLTPIRYLKNLLKRSEEAGFTHCFRQALIELGFFEYSLRVDPTGRREANLWKLVHLLFQEERRPGFNYLDFLDSNFESLSTDENQGDGDATPVIEPKRVNFMTVHASKGLQFDEVILPGMGQMPRSSNSQHFSIRESDSVWTMKVRAEDQSFKESLLAKEIVEEMRDREQQEFLRVLYVALTRAKEGVTLIWDQDIKKNSWASLVPLDCEPGLHSCEGFSYLVRNETLRPQVMTLEALKEKPLREKFVSEVSEPERTSVAVTALAYSASTGGVEVVKTIRQISQGLTRAQQGTDAHKIFEALKYQDLQTLAALGDSQMKQALEYISVLQEPPLMEIIKNGRVEWGFALKQQNYILQGQIDLWGVVGDTCWIVDYKTGSQKYADVAFQQLEAYASALSAMGKIPANSTIKLAIVYPLEKITKVHQL